MDKYAVAGAKKLLSLVKTKIRLAEDAGTVDCKPKPLPLVKRLAGKEVNTIIEAKEHLATLRSKFDPSSPENVASTVLQCMDIIEGVKYLYESPECVSHVGPDVFAEIEKEAKERSTTVNLLLLSDAVPEGINVYVGENPPPVAIYLSGVPTTVATFLAYAYGSDYFSEGARVKNIKCFQGRRTLIVNAICFSLGLFGASLD